MKSLAQLCKPRQSVFDHNRRDVVLDLTDLAEDRIDPSEFFEENYFTVGMRHLLREAFRRFAGKIAAGRVCPDTGHGGWQDPQHDYPRAPGQAPRAAPGCDG